MASAIWPNCQSGDSYVAYLLLMGPQPNSFVFPFAITVLYCPLSEIRIAVSFQCLFGRVFPWYQHWAPCSQLHSRAHQESMRKRKGKFDEFRAAWGNIGCGNWFVMGGLTFWSAMKSVEVQLAPTFFVGWFLVFTNKPDWTPQWPIFTSCRGCWSLKHKPPISDPPSPGWCRAHHHCLCH
jgi:hypothetical protein